MKRFWVVALIILALVCICAVAGAERGWKKEGDYLYYYDNNEVKVTGRQTIGGNIYYFTDAGILEGNGKIVYVSNYGRCYLGNDNKLITGWQTVDGNKYYFFPDTGIAASMNRWPYSSVLIEGYKYVFDDSDVLCINSWYNNYYGDKDGRIITGYCTIEEDKYLFDDEGYSLSGFQTINGQTHYFWHNNSGTGCEEALGWAAINTSLYYFDPDTGIMQALQRKIDGTTYSFNNDGSLKYSKPLVLKFNDGKYYAFDINAKRLLGWQTIDEETYYFYFYSYAAVTGDCNLRLDDKYSYFYFNSEGKMQRNLLIKHKPNTPSEYEAYFYYGSDGKRVTGWKTIDGKKYYFNELNGALTGTHTIDGVIYTFSDEGVLLETVVPVEGVSLNKTEIALLPGDTETLIATITPADATNKKVSWRSNNTDIATVDSNGTVTAVGVGHATIYVETEYGSHTARCSVNVEEIGLVQAFVSRCYRIILGRAADAAGLEAWSNALSDGSAAASQIIDGFVNSPEFLNKNYSNADSVIVLYRAMLGREPDAAGLEAWTDVLDQGYPFGSVINGFCGSTEFINLCNAYGILPGSVDVGPVQPNNMKKIKEFVSRCYQIILGRGADPDGLNAWAEALANGSAAASQIIDGFVNSQEFLSKNYSHAESVTVLYRAMLGRDPDPAGLAAWTEVLDQGYPFGSVINGFCGSDEFTALCNQYGITPGSVEVNALSGAEWEEEYEEPDDLNQVIEEEPVEFIEEEPEEPEVPVTPGEVMPEEEDEEPAEPEEPQEPDEPAEPENPQEPEEPEEPETPVEPGEEAPVEEEEEPLESVA